ncbi:Basic-leucine zipper transcription factor K [Hirschfeldia incana]|nr:Basic-leucine zipper transcription factor K [Hirschfeldia incana]
MGNCQAVETATAVLERPDGKSERFHCTVSASEVIKSHPGHHVALLISSSVPNGGSLRVTRIKLLRPSDNLLLGHVYRLISSEEVMKGLRAKKSEKMKKIHGEFSVEEEEIKSLTLRSESAFDKDSQRKVHEKQRGTKTGATHKVRAWQPSLQSISESTS